uniref:Vacuole membrane protein KMS1-like n=2 Tax=Rhizophora mucronata TaxID=61149 RepID=A0A2P2JK61_RHIMU
MEEDSQTEQQQQPLFVYPGLDPSNDASISRVREKHKEELENLTLATQPLRTLKLFVLAIAHCLQGLFLKNCWLLLLSALSAAIGVLVLTVGNWHGEHFYELLLYLRFGLWWVALGVASAVGLGSGLHTFVLYLGPHIALFTMKAVQCGRVDIKRAPYDTIQFNTGPSWLDKNCSAFEPPLFASFEGSRVSLTSILPEVELEAILWGIGTALGELPPYFISQAASMVGDKLEIVKELDGSSVDGTIVSKPMKQIKDWLLSHSQYLNFLTILVLASVPNPLFDLAGIMCGQFGVSFWEFFLATVIGKAIIKTHIQTAFIILICNYQLHLLETELIRMLSFAPGLATIIPNFIEKLHVIRDKFMTSTSPVSDMKVKKWGLSFGSIWNTVVWLMLINFVVRIISATAQSFLKKQQEKELALLLSNSYASSPS